MHVTSWTTLTLLRRLQSGEALGEKRRGGQRAESQMRHVTWSNRADLRLIGFHISSMVLGLQNVRYGSEIRLQI